LLNLLSGEELEGVLVHELGHVHNRDILISSIAATLGGAVTLLAEMGDWAALFGGLSGRDNDRERGGALTALLMIILAPIAAMLIQLAVSRAREYQGDTTGARFTGNPHGLASALRKLDSYSRRVPMAGVHSKRRGKPLAIPRREHGADLGAIPGRTRAPRCTLLHANSELTPCTSVGYAEENTEPPRPRPKAEAGPMTPSSRRVMVLCDSYLTRTALRFGHMVLCDSYLTRTALRFGRCLLSSHVLLRSRFAHALRSLVSQRKRRVAAHNRVVLGSENPQSRVR